LSKNKIEQVLRKYIPPSSLEYCVNLWESNPFHFIVTKKRGTKYGDYRYNSRDGSHKITVNGDLNQYNFLLTYIHEYAHLLAVEKYSNKADPHGLEWKKCFKEAMNPILNEKVFPNDILAPLIKHMGNPKASSASDLKLVTAFRAYDQANHLTPIGSLKVNELFFFNGKTYKKMELRRTRYVCLEVISQRKYLISKIALVEPVLN